jgi:hypothetical protein
VFFTWHVLLARPKFCWCILNFAGTVLEVKVVPAKDLRQQNSASARQKIPLLGKIDPSNQPTLIFLKFFLHNSTQC